MNEQAMKDMSSKLPEKLLAIARHAGQAGAGFQVLGDWNALHEFQNGVNNRLKDKGWPLFKQDGIGTWQRETEPQGSWIIEGLNKIVDRITEHKFVRSENDYEESDESLRRTLAFNLTFDGLDRKPDEIQDFILNEENLIVLEDTIKEVISDMQPKYGDPMAVKFNQLDLRKAFREAVADKFKGTKSLDGQLNDKLKELVATMKIYSKKDDMIPGIEFQGRMKEKLEAMGWPFEKDKYRADELSDQLWSLASEAQYPLSLGVRLRLQDRSTPPEKAMRDAKDFILAHIADIDVAKKAVTEELDAELATEYGLAPRHVNILYGDGKSKMANQGPKAPQGPS